MLEGVKPEGGDRRRIGVAENAEYAAFFAQSVRVEVEIRQAKIILARPGLVRIRLACDIHNRLLRLFQIRRRGVLGFSRRGEP